MIILSCTDDNISEIDTATINYHLKLIQISVSRMIIWIHYYNKRPREHGHCSAYVMHNELYTELGSIKA